VTTTANPRGILGRGSASLTRVSVGGRLPGAEPTDFQELDTECLQPGQKALQSRLVTQRAVHDGFDRLHRNAEPVEVKQSLGRENTGYPDLVVRR